MSEHQRSPAHLGVTDAATLLGDADLLLNTDPDKARNYCAQVLDALPSQLETASLRYRAEIQAADASLILGHADDALAHLGAAQALPPIPDMQARALRIQARALLMKGEMEEAHQSIALCIRESLINGQTNTQSEALMLRAQVEHGRGESLSALATLDECRNLRKQLGDIAGEIGAISNRASILVSLGRHKEALNELNYALGKLDLSPSPFKSSILVHSALGLLLESIQKNEDALGHFMIAKDAACRAQDHVAQTIMSLNAGEIARKLGRDDALELLVSARVSALELGLPHIKGAALHSLGLLHSARKRHEEAERCLVRAEEIARQIGDLDALLNAMMGRAQNGLASGHPERAIPVLTDVLGIAGENDRLQVAFDAHMLLASAFEDAEPRRSLQHLRQANALERELRAVALANQSNELANQALLNSVRQEAEHERQLRSISEQARQEAEAKVREQVEAIERGKLHDAVTGLPNRLLLRVLIAQDIRERRPFSLAVMDFDRFRGITEVLGEAGGDELLRQVAARLGGLLGNGETVARLSHDTFALILRGEREHGAVRRRAGQLMGAFTAEFAVAGAEVVIGASIGVAHFPEHAQDADDLLRAAHLSAGEAKGGAGIHVYSAMLPGAGVRSDTLSLESGLARALERHEFELHFQPLVDSLSGRPVKAEALLRWHSATLGRRSPAEFIPLLERSGLIVPVGDWVLREACRQAASWGDVRVAVNLSARQFMGGDLTDSVRRALRESGLAPEQLELEITESLMMQSPERAVQLLTDLKRTGVRVMLDDFGTGFSNLSYLHAFPLDGLKIDRSFVLALDHGERAGRIIEAIVQMGRSLGLEIIAEGIETVEQHRTLARLGVPVLQGYLFGRPQPHWRP